MAHVASSSGPASRVRPGLSWIKPSYVAVQVVHTTGTYKFKALSWYGSSSPSNKIYLATSTSNERPTSPCAFLLPPNHYLFVTLNIGLVSGPMDGECFHDSLRASFGGEHPDGRPSTLSVTSAENNFQPPTCMSLLPLNLSFFADTRMRRMPIEKSLVLCHWGR